MYRFLFILLLFPDLVFAYEAEAIQKKTNLLDDPRLIIVGAILFIFIGIILFHISKE